MCSYAFTCRTEWQCCDTMPEYDSTCLEYMITCFDTLTSQSPLVVEVGDLRRVWLFVWRSRHDCFAGREAWSWACLLVAWLHGSQHGSWLDYLDSAANNSAVNHRVKVKYIGGWGSSLRVVASSWRNLFLVSFPLHYLLKWYSELAVLLIQQKINHLTNDVIFWYSSNT